MVVPQAGASFELVERGVPAPGRHEVLIKIHACGVCHSASVTVEGLFPGIEYPRVPGREVIGVIEAIGADVDGWSVGTRVGVGWFPGACDYCRHCRRNEAFARENVHGATGVSRDGPHDRRRGCLGAGRRNKQVKAAGVSQLVRPFTRLRTDRYIG